MCVHLCVCVHVSLVWRLAGCMQIDMPKRALSHCRGKRRRERERILDYCSTSVCVCVSESMIIWHGLCSLSRDQFDLHNSALGASQYRKYCTQDCTAPYSTVQYSSTVVVKA
ncbi:hypothetical protein BCV70DRAFT_120317 [Testicularia cyperi]|uniref:Secreted protein n=1 Tax=Testicularia cyperi TaxID=1882483 RepID=A0A317XMK5_9BASI|nr:hypothetical protein BCV70DRAFT_120317 [Testicularia cyperi]